MSEIRISPKKLKNYKDITKKILLKCQESNTYRSKILKHLRTNDQINSSMDSEKNEMQDLFQQSLETDSKIKLEDFIDWESFLESEEYFEIFNEMEESIKQEEELLQYEENYGIDYLDDEVEWDHNALLCPKCWKSPLSFTSGQALCLCDLQFSIFSSHFSRILTIDELRNILSTILNRHIDCSKILFDNKSSISCLQFYSENNLLQYYCPVCEQQEIVIT